MMTRIPEPKIVSCGQWRARRPTGKIQQTGRPDGTVLHHTATLGGKDKKAFARSTQDYHMDHNGWVDSGHSFLVCTDGTILEGRHGTLDAIRRGRMVVSAHCPGQNSNPGVEHEQKQGPMTKAQRASSVLLHSWMADRCQIRISNLYRPHRLFFPTACPGQLEQEIPALREAVSEYMAAILEGPTVPVPVPIPQWFWRWAEWRLGHGDFKDHALDPKMRPDDAPETIPAWAWARLTKFES